MYTTNRNCIPAGPFSAQLVVTMRPMTPQQAIRAVQVTTRFHLTHGAPIHLGDPREIGINDLDEFDVGAVTDGDGTANAVDENAVVGTVVGITASAGDADATNNTITYSLQDDDGGRFAINSTTGIVTVNGAIDREADGPSRNITVRATSSDGSFDTAIMSVNVNDVDEFDVTAERNVDTSMPLDGRVPGGLGLHLVQQMVDNLEYEHHDRQSTVRFTKESG